MKKILQNIVSSLGFEILRSHESLMSLQMPVEINDDEREIIEDVKQNELTLVSYERLWATLTACKYVASQNIDGDFVECGVWRGGNAIVAAKFFQLNGIDKKVWCFDTFAGMTPPTDFDVTHTGQPAKEDFARMQQETHNDFCYAPP